MSFEAGLERVADGTPATPDTATPKVGAATQIDTIASAAATGVATPSQPLPFRDQLEPSFGADLSGVQAHVGGDAAASAAAMGARAYATGDHVVLPAQPSLHTVAHETAHVLQQRGGDVQLEGGVGEVGDRYELEADAAADAVVAGQPASSVMDGGGATSRTAVKPGRAAIQRDAAPRPTAAGAAPPPSDPAAAAAADLYARKQHMLDALPLVTTRWKLVGLDLFTPTDKPVQLPASMFQSEAYALIVHDQADLAPVMAVLEGPGREAHNQAIQAAARSYIADKPHLETLKTLIDDLIAGGQVAYNATRVMAHQAMLSPSGKRALATIDKLGTAALAAYVAGTCKTDGDKEQPPGADGSPGGGDLRKRGCEAILGTLRTGAPPELPAPPEAKDAKPGAPPAFPPVSKEVQAAADKLAAAIRTAADLKKKHVAAGQLSLGAVEMAQLQSAITMAGPEAQGVVWRDQALVATLARVFDPSQAKQILDALDPVEGLYRACVTARSSDEDTGVLAQIGQGAPQLPPQVREDLHEAVRLKLNSNVYQAIHGWLLARTGAAFQPLRMRLLTHTKLKDDFIDRLQPAEQRLVYRLIVRGTEQPTGEDMVHEAAETGDGPGVIRGLRVLAGTDPARLAALEHDPIFRATLDKLTQAIEIDGQTISPYQLAMVMWGRRPDERTDPGAGTQSEVSVGDDKPLTIDERLRLNRELFNPCIQDLFDEISGKFLSDEDRQARLMFKKALGDPQKVMDTLVKYDRLAATTYVDLLRRDHLIFGAEVEKRFYDQHQQPLRTWIYEHSGPNNRSGSNRVLGTEQGAGVGMFNGQVLMAGETANPGKMSLQQALRETTWKGEPLYELASVRSRELSRALDDGDKGGVITAWTLFEIAVEGYGKGGGTDQEIFEKTGIKIRAIDLMRNAFMEHGGHLETRLAVKFEGDDLKDLRERFGFGPDLDKDPSGNPPSLENQAETRFGNVAKLTWAAIGAIHTDSKTDDYAVARVFLDLGRLLPSVDGVSEAGPSAAADPSKVHDVEERPARSFAGYYRAHYGASPDLHAAAVVRALGGDRAVPTEQAATLLGIKPELVTMPVVAAPEDGTINANNRHLVRATFTEAIAASNAEQMWSILHHDGKLSLIEEELYGPFNDEEQRLIRVAFRKLSGGLDLTFYIRQAIEGQQRQMNQSSSGWRGALGSLDTTSSYIMAEQAKHQEFKAGGEGTEESGFLNGTTIGINGSASELDRALAVSMHGELDPCSRVRNAVMRKADGEVLTILDDLSVEDRRKVLKDGPLIDAMERLLSQQDYERAFKTLTGQADLADRMFQRSVGNTWWKRHVSGAADQDGMKQDVKDYVRRLRMQYDREVRAELKGKFGDGPMPDNIDQMIAQQIDQRTRAACADLSADKDVKQIVDDVLSKEDGAEVKSTLLNAGDAHDWAMAGGGGRDKIMADIRSMSADERKAKLADPAYLQMLGARLTGEKDYRDAMNALTAGADGTAAGSGGLASLDEKSRTENETQEAKPDGRAALRALAALTPEELQRLRADPQRTLQVLNSLEDDSQRVLARELLYPPELPAPAPGSGDAAAAAADAAAAKRLQDLVNQATVRMKVACQTSNKWSVVLEESIEVYKAPLDPAPPAAAPPGVSAASVPPAQKAAAPSAGTVPPGLREKIWGDILPSVNAFADDHRAHPGAVTTDAISGDQMIAVIHKAILRQEDPTDWLISAKIWTSSEQAGQFGDAAEAAKLAGFVGDDKYKEEDVMAALSGASDEHVLDQWTSVGSTPDRGGDTMKDKYQRFRAAFDLAKPAILAEEAAAAPPPEPAPQPSVPTAQAAPAEAPPELTAAADAANVSMPGAPVPGPAPAPAKPVPKWEGEVHQLGGSNPLIADAELAKQQFLEFMIGVSGKFEAMLRPYMGDNRELTKPMDPSATKIAGTGNKRYDNLTEVVMGRLPRIKPDVFAKVIGVAPEDQWILHTAARTEIMEFGARHEKNLRSRGAQTSERSIASDEKEALDVSRLLYGRALAVGLTDAKLDSQEAANISHLGDQNDRARDAYKQALETAAMWASLIVGTLVTIAATILTGGLALGPVAAMAIGGATAALSATAKAMVNKSILDNEWDSKDTSELIAHEVITSLVTIGTTFYAQKLLSAVSGASTLAKQAANARGVFGSQPPFWRVFLDQSAEQVASQAMGTVVDAGLEATDPMHFIDGYREGAKEAKAAGLAKLSEAPGQMVTGVVQSLLTAGIGKVLRPGQGTHVAFDGIAAQERKIDLMRNLKFVFRDPEQKFASALVEWGMNQKDPIDWSSAPAELMQGTMRQYGQAATETHTHTAGLASRGRHADAQIKMYEHDMPPGEQAAYRQMNEHAGSSDPLSSARDFSSLRTQVVETGLGQWEAANPQKPLTPEQRAAFVRWARDAGSADELAERAKTDPFTVDKVVHAAPKPVAPDPISAASADPVVPAQEIAPHQRKTEVHQAQVPVAERVTAKHVAVDEHGVPVSERPTAKHVAVDENGLPVSERPTAKHVAVDEHGVPVSERPTQTHEAVDPHANRPTMQMPVVREPEPLTTLTGPRKVYEEVPEIHAAKQAPPEAMLGEHTLSRVEPALQAMSDHDYLMFKAVMAAHTDPVAQAFLLKAIAAGHPMSEVQWLADEIGANDATWMVNNLTLGDPNQTGGGLKQQWAMSCNASMTLTVRGNYDPIFALKMRQRNDSIGDADVYDPTGAGNTHQADLEKSMLESKYKNPHWGEASVDHVGKAESLADGGGVGRPADDLLSDLQKYTGLTYKPRFLGSPAEAVPHLEAGLSKGMEVPMIIGNGADKKNAHYVVAMRRREGANGPEYQFHDTASGATIWVTAHQVASGKMPLGWEVPSAVEVPTAVPYRPHTDVEPPAAHHDQATARPSSADERAVVPAAERPTQVVAAVDPAATPVAERPTQVHGAVVPESEALPARRAGAPEQDPQHPGAARQVDPELERIRNGTPGVIRDESQLSSADVARSMNDELQPIKANEVKSIIDTYPASQRDEVRAVLARSSGFASLEALNPLREAIQVHLDGRGGRLYAPGSGSLADNIAYVAGKETFDTALPHAAGRISTTPDIEPNAVVILDRVVLAQMEDPAFRQKLVDNHCVLLEPVGFNSGINMYNNADPQAVAEHAQRILKRAQEIHAHEPTRPFDHAIDTALGEKTAAVLQQTPGLEGQLRKVEGVAHGSSDDDISRQLNGDAGITAADLDAALAKVGSPREAAILREALAQQGDVFSARRFANDLAEHHQKVMAAAAAKGVAKDDVYFYIPKADKSYGMIAMAHREATNTKVDHYINGHEDLQRLVDAGKLTSRSMVVIFDDVAGSGSSLHEAVMDYKGRGDAIENTTYDGHVYVSPMVSTEAALQRFNGGTLWNDTPVTQQRANVTFDPKAMSRALTESAFFQALSPRDQGELEYLVGSSLFEDNRLSMAFPYMAPDNNNTFFGDAIAKFFIMNKNRAASKARKWNP